MSTVADEAVAAGPVSRVTRKLLADGETAVGLYRKLAQDRPGTFLLESAENGRSWSRYSFIGVRAAATLTEKDGRAHWIGDPPPGVPTVGTPLDVLAGTVAALRGPRDASLPPLVGGMVGFVTYDAVRRLEKLPDDTIDDLHLPELVMFLVTDLAVLDHHDGSVLLIANVLPGDSAENADEAPRRDDGGAAESGAVDRGDHERRGHSAAGAPNVKRANTCHGSSGLVSTSGPATSSRWCQASGSRHRRQSAHSTSTGCYAPATRVRTSTCCGSMASTSSAPAPKRT